MRTPVPALAALPTLAHAFVDHVGCDGFVTVPSVANRKAMNQPTRGAEKLVPQRYKPELARPPR